jgi:hypothetical protein
MLLTVVNCLFDASSAIFLVFDQIHRTGNILPASIYSFRLQTHFEGGISRQNMFDGYAVLAAVILGSVSALWFRLKWKAAEESKHEQEEQKGDKGPAQSPKPEESLAKKAVEKFPTYHHDTGYSDLRASDALSLSAARWRNAGGVVDGGEELFWYPVYAFHLFR